MRRRASRHLLLTLPSFLLCFGCGDDKPIYPPIVINIIGGGADGIGVSNPSGNATGSGAEPSTSGGSGNSGGSSNGGGGGLGAGGLLAHCSAFVSGETPASQCDMDDLKDGGELKGDITDDLTLKTGYSYTLKGSVRVMPEKTLTIEPCVKVIGANTDAVLIVMASTVADPDQACKRTAGAKPTKAAKLVAVGEPNAPIVFTSAKKPGQRAPGDWGGVLLLGNAETDLANNDYLVPVEGLASTECYGWNGPDYDDDDSGHLEYVRIEYASRQSDMDSETNGLTFAAVGSATEVHYVEVSNSADDCFEWFGGTVNADHLIALNCDDDEFDGDTGYSGKLQFLFGRQARTTTESNTRGLEISQGAGNGQNKLTSQAFSNLTLCGNTKSVQSNGRVGIYLENVPQVSVMNTFVTGFVSGGLQVASAAAQMSYTHIFDENPLIVGTDLGTFAAGMGDSSEEPDRFCNCWADPPAPVPATPITGGKPSGFGDEAATYVGAFKDATAESNWMKGMWVDWSDK